MRRVIAGIGVPGSGKTTVLKALAEREGHVYISPDDIREELTGDPSDNSDNKRVWETAYARLQDALSTGQSAVFDATQAKAHERREFVSRAREYGADEVVGMYFDVPVEVALERNAKRKRQVPERAVRRMYELLEKDPPSAEEGFDEVVRIDEAKATL